MNYPAQRRQALVRRLKEDGVDTLLVTEPVNVAYLTGFTGGASYYATTARQGVLITDSRFEEQVREECPDVGKDRGGPALDVHVRPHDRTTLEATAEVLGKLGARAVGVEANRLTIGDLEALKGLAPKLTFVLLPDLVETLRAVKDPSEIEQIRDAVRIAERAYRMFIATLREADTEKDMVDTLEGYVRRSGARCTSFPPIVAVGERGALPHAPPSARQLGDGSKLLIDWGADIGYKSDITRTIRNPFGMAPTRRNRKERVGVSFEAVYAAVLAAQTAALAAIRDGVKAKDVDAAARNALATARVKGDLKGTLVNYFTHGLGHGIGLEIHEAPRVRANSEDVLEAGMVITIEPGVYIPEWGGVRIEDDVLVTREGCTLLTSLPRDLPPAG